MHESFPMQNRLLLQRKEKNLNGINLNKVIK